MRLWHCSFLSSKCWPCSGHSLNCHVFQLEQLTSWVFIREFNQYKGMIRRRNANIKRINPLTIHFYTVFSRMSCLSQLWTLASSCWRSTRGTLTLEVQLLTSEEVKLSYLPLIFFRDTLFRLKTWKCAGWFGTCLPARMHAGKTAQERLQRLRTKTPSCGLLRTSQAGKEAQSPFS